MKTKAYEKALKALQIDLVETQKALIETGGRVVVVLEGRDAAGKDGVIKRITEHLTPRNTRVAALPKPSEREQTQWYFQRYVQHFPAAGEIVLFNRSWYNRGGVEPVMGFCTEDQHRRFLRDAPVFEDMLIGSGISLIKYWLDISREEQAERLKARTDDPLKALKVSPLDAEAQKRWDAYTAARDEMLTATHTDAAPWTCVRNDKKKPGRIALISDLVRKIAPKDVARRVEKPDRDILFPFETAALTDGRLAR